ncbi:hypothetical protein [Pseudohongiella sp.]|uniref:Uncharacterized protein n=1 Tax=marine sediment metagenome TaxID=412755 RepID=A0A0F9W698_9ZZZZ|nr:hypothetical protein [Pseudohongiella sp.]HDZ08963.1 hypothetical protein [Pseudohongiella sp.]HEA62648.1 hypothetical protein [Pseudohongiella sp.]
MKNKSRYKTRVGQLVVAGVISGFGVYANANDFTIESSSGTQGQFTLSNGSGFSATPAVDNTGTVAAINNVPLTASFGIPNFAFTLGNAATPTDTTYSFRVGVSITELNTNRRLEAYIGTLNLNVNNTTVTGSIPGSQDMTVLARAGSLNATTTLTNNANNGPITISGGGVSFSGSNLVNRLSPDSLFENILGEFNTGGNTYDYNIVIQQSGSTNGAAPAAEFGINNGGFTSFTPAALGGSEFDLNSDQIQNFFGGNNVYKVSGRFTTAATSSGGGGGGGGTPATQVPAETVTGTETAANNLNNAITSGTPAEAQTALGNVATSLETVANSVTGGATLSEEQTAQVQTNVQAVFNNITTLLNNVGNDEAALTTAVTTLNNTLAAMQRANVPATAAIVNSVVAAGQASARIEARRKAGLGADATPAQVAAALSTDPDALEASIRQSIRIPPTTVRTQSQQQTTVNTALSLRPQGGGASSQKVTIAVPKSELVTVSTSDCATPQPVFNAIFGFAIGPGSACLLRQSAELSFSDHRMGGTLALATEGTATVTTDDVTGILTIQLPGEAYAGYITAARAAPAEVPTGIRILRNGTAIMINNGYSMELAPVPVDTLGFALAVSQAGYSDMNFSADDGAYRIDFGGGQRFAGVFAYDNLNGKTLDFNCGGTSIVEPTIAPTDADYGFAIDCANGVRQRLLPYMDNTNFFASLQAAQIPYQVDRSTGIITSEGNGRFKPSFFISPLTAAETAFHAANKDANGVAFQAMDVNGDGRIDFKVIAPNGTQVLYGVN